MGNTDDVVVVRPNAFHSGSEIASSAAITSGNAAGSQPAIAAFTAISSTVATPLAGGSTQSAWSAGYGVAASSASIGIVGGGQHRHAVAPTLGDRALVLLAWICADLELLAREGAHAFTPSSASTCG